MEFTKQSDSHATLTQLFNPCSSVTKSELREQKVFCLQGPLFTNYPCCYLSLSLSLLPPLPFLVAVCFFVCVFFSVFKVLAVSVCKATELVSLSERELWSWAQGFPGWLLTGASGS